MRYFEIYAYENGCRYSTRVMEYFKKHFPHRHFSLHEIPRETNLNEYFKSDYHKHPSLPRIYFNNTLLYDCDSFFKCLNYVKSIKSNKTWTGKDIERFRSLIRHQESARTDDMKSIMVLLHHFTPE